MPYAKTRHCFYMFFCYINFEINKTTVSLVFVSVKNPDVLNTTICPLISIFVSYFCFFLFDESLTSEFIAHKSIKNLIFSVKPHCRYNKNMILYECYQTYSYDLKLIAVMSPGALI